MPSHFGPDLPPDSDESDEERNKKDQYGDRFQDFGFLERATEKKEKGNAQFKKERYEKAIQHYDESLEDCLMLSGDPSIVLGKKKWAEVIVFRSTVHLNKSACHFKMGEYGKAVTQALECLVGNQREQKMYTDPHIKKKIKDKDRQNGSTGVCMVEDRLPRSLRAKAWFRMSKSYAQLGFYDRARESLAKALEMADDPSLLGEIAQHGVHVEALEKREHEKQRKQFKGFFNKLQDRGGYVDQKEDIRAHWDSLDYEEKFRRVEELDDSDEEPAALPLAPQGNGGRPAATPMTPQQCQEARSKVEGLLSQSMGVPVENVKKSFDKEWSRHIDQSFDQHLRQKAETPEVAVPAPAIPPVAPPPPPRPDVVPPRPAKSEEASLRWVAEEQRATSGRDVPVAAEAWRRSDARVVEEEEKRRIEAERGRVDAAAEAERARAEAASRVETRRKALESLDDSDDDGE